VHNSYLYKTLSDLFSYRNRELIETANVKTERDQATIRLGIASLIAHILCRIYYCLQYDTTFHTVYVFCFRRMQNAGPERPTFTDLMEDLLPRALQLIVKQYAKKTTVV